MNIFVFNTKKLIKMYIGEDQKYQVQEGISFEQLTKKYDCPLYVYDGNIIERQYRRLYDAFDIPSLKLHYACKALTNINILKIVKNLGAGLDTVSFQEVRLGLRAGFEASEIMYTPNCVSLDEIDQAVEAGVKINIDNLSILEQFGQKYPDYPVCVRLNPHIMAGGNSKISTGHIDSKFGISIHQVPHIKRIVETTGLKVEGLHMHTGSDILDTDVFIQGAEVMLSFSSEFPDLEFIDLGSGFKVPYYEGAIATDIEDLGRELSKKFKAFCKGYGRDLTLIFEPGKFLVSEAGYFLTQVNVVKQTTSTVFAGVDSGLNHLIRPMLYDAYHEIVNISKTSGRTRIYTIVGYICETDTFGVNRKLHEVQEGDILCFKNAGAYCFMMASNYNSRYRPAEVLVYNGEEHLIREREDFEDLMAKQIEITNL